MDVLLSYGCFQRMSHQTNQMLQEADRRTVLSLSKTEHTPADDHGCDDGLPSGVEQRAAGWVFGGDDDPQRSQTHEEGTDHR